MCLVHLAYLFRRLFQLKISAVFTFLFVLFSLRPHLLDQKYSKTLILSNIDNNINDCFSNFLF